jgi:hypothetical protein
LTQGFGAVKLMSTFGMKLCPGPCVGGPVSISQLDGASTDRTGTEVDERRVMTDGKGSRRGPLKEKPKTASMTWSAVFREPSKSVVKGTSSCSSWVFRRA